jgi:hypothetical protein
MALGVGIWCCVVLFVLHGSIYISMITNRSMKVLYLLGGAIV